MAFKTYTLGEYKIRIHQRTAGEDSVTSYGAGLNISQYGAVIVNPYDQMWKYREGNVPQSSSAFNIADRAEMPVDMVIRGQFWAADDFTDSLFLDLATVFQTMANAMTRDDMYISLETERSGGTTIYRRYCQFTRVNWPMVPKTRMLAMRPYTLQARCYDPHWYDDFVTVEPLIVINGNTVFSVNFSGNHITERVVWEIKKDGVDDVTTPTITVADPQGDRTCTLNGSLTIANERYVIDCYHGTVKKGVATLVDAIGDFSGEFPIVREGIRNVTCTDSSSTNDFLVTLNYLSRWM